MIDPISLVLMAEVAIQPSFQPPSVVDLARPIAELANSRPLDWTCSVRAPSGPEFIVAGRFESPSATSRGRRPMSLRMGGPEPLSGSGSAGWAWSSRRDGRYWFEVKAPRMTYTAEMDFIEVGQQGYIKLLSVSGDIAERPPAWQVAGLGFCKTTAGAEGGTER